MKLLTFEKGGVTSVGAGIDEGIVDLTAALKTTNPELTGTDSMLSIIQSGMDISSIGQASIASLRSNGTLSQYLVTGFTWKPPILNPPKILALALNFQEHINETNLSFFDEPIVFPKYNSNMLAHDGNIELPPFPQHVDEELELAVVFGKDARHISASEAPDYVFGYTICNDVSARDRQGERARMGQPYEYAKNFATFCPLGPWIVTKDEIPSPDDLNMEVRVNEQVTRSGNSGQMIFDTFEVMAYCSDYTPMEAGDIISLGTFAGEKTIKDGDLVELEI